MHVRVVSSSQPLPSTVDDLEPNGRSSQTETINVLANDFNPFPDKPLKIIDATVNSGNATVSISGPNLIITPGPDKSQQVSVIYKVQDATQDPNRQAQGRADVIVTSAPDQPQTPTLVAEADRIRVTINPSPSSNGAEITEYTVTRTGGGANVVQKGQAGNVLAFTGTNGTEYTFNVYATNKVGDSERSPSASAISYGKPSAPTNVKLSRDGRWAKTTMTLTWDKPGDTGGSITSYNWEVGNGGGNGTVNGANNTSAKTNSVGAGTYSNGRVQACGNGGCGPWGQVSNSVIVENEPPPPPPNPRITDVYGTDGPKTRNDPYGNPVSNTYVVGFSWAEYPGGSYNITPQYCSGGSWHDVSRTYSVPMSGNNSHTTTAFVQVNLASCGIRVLVNGTPSDGYSFP